MSSPPDRADAFRRIYETHYRAVAAYAGRRASPHDAEDVVAETFLIAWRRLEDIPPESLTLPWLYVVARRVLSQRLRGARRRERLLSRLFGQPSPGPGGDPRQGSATDPAVHAALSTLRPNDQELLRLAEWEELTHTELAQLFNCTTATISVRLHRAHRRFAQALRSVEEQAKSAGRGEASA